MNETPGIEQRADWYLCGQLLAEPAVLLQELLDEYRVEKTRRDELCKDLVTLLRFAYLVRIDGRRVKADDVGDPALRDLLFSILQAKDTAAAKEAVLA